MAGADDITEDRTGNISDDSQLATFRIGDELFGLGISNIREIVRYPEITSVPRSPAYLTGLANMRGSVLPVIDARIRLGLAAAEPTDATRVLVIEHNGVATGMIVDMVCGVISLEHVEKETPPSLLDAGAGVDTRYVKSVVKADGGRKIIMEIDAEALCLTELNRGSSSSSSRSAAGADDRSAGPAEIQLVTFLVAREEYGFPIESVREVLRIGKITEVPDVAPYFLGILSVRNALLPVVDIRRLFGLSGQVDDLCHELNEVNRFAQHLRAAFTQHLSRGSAWTADTTVNAVRQWFDTLHTSSEVLGKQFLLLRVLCQKLLSVMASARQQGRNISPEAVARVLDEVQSYAEQITLRVEECKTVLPQEIQEDQRILVIEIGRMPVGILVDRMQQVVRLPEDIIEQTPMLLHSQSAATLKGIVKLNSGKRLVMLINQEKMLRCEELAELGDGGYATNGSIETDFHSQKSEDSIQLVTFRLGEEEFGLAIEEVQEINRLDGITTVPRTPDFVEGVMNLRGNVIPAIDLRKRFGLEAVEHDESTRVIIVNMNGKLTGFIVDSVSEVFRLERRLIELPPDVIRTDLHMDFIKGICKSSQDGSRMVVLIEVSKILAGHEQELLAASMAGTTPSASAPQTVAKPVPVKPVAPPAPAEPIVEALLEPLVPALVLVTEPPVAPAEGVRRPDDVPEPEVVPDMVPIDVPFVAGSKAVLDTSVPDGLLTAGMPEITPEGVVVVPVIPSKKKLKRA